MVDVHTTKASNTSLGALHYLERQSKDDYCKLKEKFELINMVVVFPKNDMIL